MAKFHSLKVTNVRKETEDCVSVAFEIPSDLKKEYHFIQGQYVTVKFLISGEDLRRSYSICSSPVSETEFRIAAKSVKDGRVSTFINKNLKTGDAVDVMTPMGNFHSELNPANEKNYVLFSGGSGITPVFSIIKTILQVETKSKITLFYGNRDEASTIFKEQLNELEKKSSRRLKIYNILEIPEKEKAAAAVAAAEQEKEKAAGAVAAAEKDNSALFTGMMTIEKTEELIKRFTELNSVNEFFICGPLPMMNNVKSVLEKMKVEKEKIHIEYFTTVLEDIAKAESSYAKATEEKKIVSSVTVILDGNETTFELSSTGKVILDAAIEKDLDVPFACKGAVCCTCKAKLLEGKVQMDMNYALTDGEVKSGYILTCQSHPVTEKVVVSYDEI